MKQKQRLDKVLSNFGFGSRTEIKSAVKKGLVTVDGQVAKDSGVHVDPAGSVIMMNGIKLEYRKYIYLMMNKPQGVISATTDTRQRTVFDILPEEYKCFELFPAGRLDIDTEGLVLMTNDGQLAHEILSPRKHVTKKYYARVEGRVEQADAAAFEEGVTLDDGYKTLPAKLEILSTGQMSEIRLSIVEGKFHQVKRMFEAVGKKVIYLKRLSMGRLELDEGLELGECRELAPEEVELLKDSVQKH
ncbi:ribosomal large subunit pseudouridine synthase B [Ruminiclostridium hungatei]|uniref:Pseudouridine synthase n=1 Tax=Ruminiclostridium hungatei TaxID=48256 RepID=A0A1V4SGI3_RUMHU|nr:pseudouridine synthase [Ruminiclostridium hungatei]OPX43042.1 ribosomal large subunit pseudouridine synthase B [Ruminiclostridium hungatei]